MKVYKYHYSYDKHDQFQGVIIASSRKRAIVLLMKKYDELVKEHNFPDADRDEVASEIELKILHNELSIIHDFSYDSWNS